MFYPLTKTGAIHVYLITFTIILVIAVLFLLPALINGFPLVFYDTDEYVYAAAHRYLPEDRPVYYSIFTMIFDLRRSPWPSVIFQSLVTA